MQKVCSGPGASYCSLVTRELSSRALLVNIIRQSNKTGNMSVCLLVNTFWLWGQTSLYGRKCSNFQLRNSVLANSLWVQYNSVLCQKVVADLLSGWRGIGKQVPEAWCGNTGLWQTDLEKSVDCRAPTFPFSFPSNFFQFSTKILAAQVFLLQC